MSGCSTVRHGLSGLRAAQRFALAAPPNAHSLNATAMQKNKRSYTAAGGVGYRRCWAGAWQMTGLRDAQPGARQGHRGRHNGQGHDETRSGDGAIRDVIRHQTIPHATIISYAVPGDRAIRHAMIISHSRISAYVCVYLRMSPIIFSGVMLCHFSHSLRLSGGAVARWCGGPVA